MSALWRTRVLRGAAAVQSLSTRRALAVRPMTASSRGRCGTSSASSVAASKSELMSRAVSAPLPAGGVRSALSANAVSACADRNRCSSARRVRARQRPTANAIGGFVEQGGRSKSEEILLLATLMRVRRSVVDIRTRQEGCNARRISKPTRSSPSRDGASRLPASAACSVRRARAPCAHRSRTIVRRPRGGRRSCSRRHLRVEDPISVVRTPKSDDMWSAVIVMSRSKSQRRSRQSVRIDAVDAARSPNGLLGSRRAAGSLHGLR